MDGLTEQQIRVAPHPGVNTIAWLIWHVARVEDVGVNRLVVDDRQVFDRGGWAPRLNVARRDFGTGMTPGEVHEMSARIDLDALRAYWEAVGRRTEEVVAGLRAEELDEVRDAEYPRRRVGDLRDRGRAVRGSPPSPGAAAGRRGRERRNGPPAHLWTDGFSRTPITSGQPSYGLGNVRIPTRLSKPIEPALSRPVPATSRRTPSVLKARSISAPSASVA